MANQLQFILVRHGESTANADETVRSQVPEHLIPLTDVGIQQAKQAGEKVRQLLTEYGAEEDQRVYYSPYLRARQTLKHMELGLSFEKIRSDARLVEINYGLDNALEGYEKEQMKKAIEKAGGRFFYRHPDGESYTDVQIRLASIYQDIRLEWLAKNKPKMSVVLVCHSHVMVVWDAVIAQNSYNTGYEHLDGPYSDIANGQVNEYISDSRGWGVLHTVKIDA